MTDLFTRAVPYHPERLDVCLCPFPSTSILGFIIFGRLAASTGVTRPNRVRLRYGSHDSPYVASPAIITETDARSASCQTGNYNIGTLTRSDQPGFARRTERHENELE